jgi:hypothetical protein
MLSKYVLKRLITRKLIEQDKVRVMQNVYEVFFPFLFFISIAHNMRWKNFTLFFDGNSSFRFHGPSKFFRFGNFEHFFQTF